MAGLHKTIEVSFMLVGHTKFSPDWFFGLLKHRFRRSKISSLDDLVQVVRSSAFVNEAELVGSQLGEPLVPIYDWVGFFGSQMNKVPLITRQHHFNFSSDCPGTVIVREFSDSGETKFIITEDDSWGVKFPEVITPPGMTTQRQWYLYDKIRDYCSEEAKDLVCPKPLVPRPRGNSQPRTVQQSPLSPPRPTRSTGTKKRRVCGTCGEVGHTKRTCPDRDED